MDICKYCPFKTACAFDPGAVCFLDQEPGFFNRPILLNDLSSYKVQGSDLLTFSDRDVEILFNEIKVLREQYTAFFQLVFLHLNSLYDLKRNLK